MYKTGGFNGSNIKLGMHGLPTHEKIRIPLKNKHIETPPSLRTMLNLWAQRRDFLHPPYSLVNNPTIWAYMAKTQRKPKKLFNHMLQISSNFVDSWIQKTHYFEN